MPELPEVETVRRTLVDKIVGKKIKSVEVLYDGIIKGINPDDFITCLEGQTITDIKRYGKYLIFILDDYALISHLRMEGKYYLKDCREEIAKHEHILLVFDDDTDMRYHDTRKFGTMSIEDKVNYMESKALKKLGKEPFEGELSVNYLRNVFNKSGRKLKPVLLDQTIICGLGNIYVDEVCFNAKLHPETIVSTLKDEDINNIIESSYKVIAKAINLGGTTIKSYTSSLGVTGRFQNELNVHTRKDEECPRCGTIIEKIKVGGRGTYFCPVCQQKR